jgi:hypothetical protein
VYSLNLDDTNPEWTFLKDIPSGQMIEPWFTTSRGILEIDDNLYVACHDRRDGKIYSFDEQYGTFAEISAIPFDFTEDCCAVGITVSGDDRIYITGGIQPTNNDPTAQVIYYSISKDKWYQKDPLNTARSHHACTAVTSKSNDHNKYIYVIGGVHRTNLHVFSSIEVYDINNEAWQQYDNVLNPARRSFGAISIRRGDSNEIVLIGGDGRSPGDPNGADPLALVDILDVSTNTIITDANVPQLNFGRVSPATTFDADGCIMFVVTGQDSNGVRTDTETWNFQCDDGDEVENESGDQDGDDDDEDEDEDEDSGN